MIINEYLLLRRRYIDYREFEGVYRNWNYLRDFYASHPQYNVKLKLGTLADYFK